MINGTWEEFWEFLSTGLEIFMRYNGHEYLIQGWWKEETNTRFLCVCDLTAPETDPLYIWSMESDSMEKNAKAFLDAKIFFGKSFMEVEAEMDWFDG